MAFVWRMRLGSLLRRGWPTQREMSEKKALYFAAGAEEVWFCDAGGEMTFYVNAGSVGDKKSRLCPEFPGTVRLE